MLYELLRTFNLLVGWATAAGQCDVDKFQVLAVIVQQKEAGHFLLRHSTSVVTNPVYFSGTF